MKTLISFILCMVAISSVKAQDTIATYKILPDDYASHKVYVRVQNRGLFKWECNGIKLVIPEYLIIEKIEKLKLLNDTWKLVDLDSAIATEHSIGATTDDFSLVIYKDGQEFDHLAIFTPDGIYSQRLGFVKPADNDYCLLFQTLVE